MYIIGYTVGKFSGKQKTENNTKLLSHDLCYLHTGEFHIERGRYENVPRDERFCKCCNMSQIESEYHFLLVCPLYTELRRKFFIPYFFHWPNLNKFDQLMLSNPKQVTLSIEKFIFSAQELRKSVLNP